MKKFIAKFVQKCLICQQVKAEYQRASRILVPLPYLEWKWSHITMDFIMGLPRASQGLDVVWVVVDRLTKFAYFLPIQINYSMDKLAQIYLQEIV